jgi:DNA-binding transcriptional LysR family regulator
MTYEQIKNFITIVEVGSFKAASEQLHKSQPSLSVSIKKLEEELGIQLFSREQYRPKLTSHGHIFYSQAQETLKSFYELETLGKELSLGVEASITLAIDAIVPLHYLGPALQRFFSDKKTELNLSMEVLEGSYVLLEQDKADMAIAPLLGHGEGFKTTPLFQVRMIPVISSELSKDPLRQRLKEIPQVIVTSSQRASTQDFGINQGQGKKWYVSDHSLKAHLIKSSLGWGRLPEHLVLEDLQQGKLVRLKLENVKESHVDIGLVKKSNKALGKIGSKLWRLLEDSQNNHLFDS